MPVPITSELRTEIRKMWDTMQIRPEKAGDVKWCVTQILKNKSRYQKVEQACDVPWWLVAVIHAKEASFRFDRWLANGDPLTDATVQVPKGLRVPEEVPPYSWEGAAIRSLKHDKVNEIKDYSLESVLWYLEQWNGLGYRRRDLPSQYIWAFTNHEKPGRYVADGVFDATRMSGSCGCAAMLCSLALMGEIAFSPKPEEPKPEPMPIPTAPKKNRLDATWFEVHVLGTKGDRWEVGVVAKLRGSDKACATLRIPVDMDHFEAFKALFPDARDVVVAAAGKPWPGDLK